jgi:hypothetical protein
LARSALPRMHNDRCTWSLQRDVGRAHARPRRP